MSYFSVPARWRIPTDAVRHSFTEMARDGIHGCEGIAMWLGRHEGDTAIITHVVRLRGPGIQKSPDRLLISADLVNDLTDVAIENKLTLIGQIHSHSAFCGTDLSAVAPDFALRAGTTIEECGIHVFIPGQRWQRLSPQDVRQRISVVDGVNVPVLVAGPDE
jgi:hypothetical protein